MFCFPLQVSSVLSVTFLFSVSWQVHRAPAPAVLGLLELTSLCYGADTLLYCGTNSGQVCVWDTETNRCFMTWEADDGEIGGCKCPRRPSGL